MVMTCNAQKSKSDCNFTVYRPLSISHLLLKAVVKEVKPQYPAAARFAGIKGEVIVRILVDRKGDVKQACVVSGHPLLRAAARKAALEWKYKENFGVSENFGVTVKQPKKLRFIQTEIVFRFVD